MQGQGLLYCFALLLALSSSYSAAAAAAAGLSSEAPVPVYLNNKSKVGLMLLDRISYEAEWGVAMDHTEMGRRVLAGADPKISYNAVRQADKPAIQPARSGNSYTRGGNSYYRK